MPYRILNACCWNVKLLMKGQYLGGAGVLLLELYWEILALKLEFRLFVHSKGDFIFECFSFVNSYTHQVL